MSAVTNSNARGFDRDKPWCCWCPAASLLLDAPLRTPPACSDASLPGDGRISLLLLLLMLPLVTLPRPPTAKFIPLGGWTMRAKIWIEPRTTTSAIMQQTSRCCLVVVDGAASFPQPPLRWCRRRGALSTSPLRELVEPPLSQEDGVGGVLINVVVDQLLLPSSSHPSARFWRNMPLLKPYSSFLRGDTTPILVSLGGDEFRQPPTAVPNQFSLSD